MPFNAVSRTLLALLFVIISINSACATAISSDIKQAITERVNFGLSQSIAIAVYENGQSDFFAYGTTDINGGNKPDDATIFEVGSISKVFVATLLADKVAKGLIKLDDKISTFLPKACRSEQLDDITFELLATHYSGLPRMPANYAAPYYNLKPVGYSKEAMCDYLSSPKDKSASGIEYDYSNLGFGLLGFLLETIDGRDLDTQIKETIAKPLNMTNTGMGFNNIDTKRLAQGHHGRIRTAYFPNGMLDGSGAVLTTTNDLMNFLLAHLDSRNSPLSDALALTMKPRRKAWDDTDIGLAWHIQKTSHNQKIYWHNGSTGGFHGFVAFDQANKKAVVVLANSGGDGNDDLGFAFLDPEQKIKSTPQHQEIKLDNSKLSQLVGVYDTEFGVAIEITQHGNQLKAKFGEQFALNIYPESNNSFFYRAIDATISFEHSAQGITLFLHQGGESYPAKLRQ